MFKLKHPFYCKLMGRRFFKNYNVPYNRNSNQLVSKYSLYKLQPNCRFAIISNYLKIKFLKEFKLFHNNECQNVWIALFRPIEQFINTFQYRIGHL